MSERTAEDFDESDYLAGYPDVAGAVAGGAFPSGWAHFDQHGRAEGRSPRPRHGKLLNGLDLADLVGLEVGALCNPVLTPDRGRVIYADYADTAFLRDKFAGRDLVDVDQIVDVTAIWGDNTLREALVDGGNPAQVDYVLASHVIEHVPDVVTWLQEITEVLSDGGTLRLIVPDMRFTFDRFRTETSLTDVLDAWIRRARAPLPRSILDHHLNTREVDQAAAWRDELVQGDLRRYHSDADAIATARDALDRGTYHDVHCWVFSPASFARLLAGLARAGVVTMACQRLVPTADGEAEFFAVLAPCADPAEAAASWDRAAQLA